MHTISRCWIEHAWASACWQVKRGHKGSVWSPSLILLSADSEVEQFCARLQSFSKPCGFLHVTTASSVVSTTLFLFRGQFHSCSFDVHAVYCTVVLILVNSILYKTTAMCFTAFFSTFSSCTSTQCWCYVARHHILQPVQQLQTLSLKYWVTIFED